MRIDAELQLERGGRLLAPRIAYHTYGTLDKPVVWVCHALTANSDVFDWWSGLFGPLDLFNPNDYFIVCANVLGSCYGTEGPLSIPEGEKTPYFHQFPEITIRDMVAAHEALRKKLGIEKIHLLIGGSLGGQQALEWSVYKPELFENLALIATNARHSAWGIAFNEAQRMAIRADQSWANSEKKAGEAGMRAARATALLSYRHYDAYGATQTDSDSNPDVYKSVSYQQYQGEKLARRFNAFSYYRLSQAMDSHHLGRNRPSVAHALAGIKARTLCISISSDLLFPPQEQQYLAEHIPGARYTSISSEYGHDGFLVETRKLGALLQEFLHPAETDSSILAEGERPAFPG
ncbi:MAG: homoserine O-acetyltransferase [Bacteroidetes bacterium]|nr:homoserine O-acetyltransferase [Bacteroidota bacterium]